MTHTGKPLTCSFGSPWPCGPCDQCKAFVEEACRAFARDVFFGIYDAEGYTPAERRAKELRERT